MGERNFEATERKLRSRKSRVILKRNAKPKDLAEVIHR